ncbi:efflux RND transporter periplasmic adaptor subunit [bacterium]|nr:efflux RND transporter periplasmic adaptor subunit [bacterium]
MDMAINQNEIRKGWFKRVTVGLIVVVALVLFVIVLRFLLAPSVKRSAIRTAVVERGRVAEALNGTGTIIPEFEQVISCPFETRLLSLNSHPGALLDSGDVIANLDDREVAANVKSLSDQIELKRNKREQLDLDLARQLGELEGEIAILGQRIEYLAAKTEQQRELFKSEVATVWAVRQAELDESIERIRLDQAQSKMERLRETTQKQIEGLNIELRLLDQQLDQAQEQLDRAIVRAAWSGVLTWVVDEEGMALHRGDVLARVSNLSSYRVEATLSDIHASRLTAGMPTEVVLGDSVLTGRVQSVLPSTESGTVKLVVSLDQPSHPLLRSNLRVETYVIPSHVEKTLRLKKGAYASGSGRTGLFVIHGSRAVRVPSSIGLTGRAFNQIKSGPAEGDDVILSDMSRFQHLDEVRVRN